MPHQLCVPLRQLTNLQLLSSVYLCECLLSLLELISQILDLLFEVVIDLCLKGLIGAGRDSILLLDHLDEVVRAKASHQHIPDLLRTASIRLSVRSWVNLPEMCRILSSQVLDHANLFDKLFRVHLIKFDSVLI